MPFCELDDAACVVLYHIFVVEESGGQHGEEQGSCSQRPQSVI